MLGTKSAARKATVNLNGRRIAVEVSDDGKRLFVPVGGRVIEMDAKSGSYKLDGEGALHAVEQREEDEVAQRVTRIRASKGTVPASERPSVRRLATILARREAHQAAFRAGYDQGRSDALKATLDERLSDADTELLLERVVAHVVGERALRQSLREVLDVADLMDPAPVDERSDEEIAEQVTEPTMTDAELGRRLPQWTASDDDELFAEDVAPVAPAPAWDVPISSLIDSISDEVGEPVVHAPGQGSTEVPTMAPAATQGGVSAPVQAGPARATVMSTINFGLTSVAVGVHNLHTSHGVQLRWSHSGCGGRVAMPKVCKDCNETLSSADLGRCTEAGHQLTADQVTNLSDIGKSIEIDHFSDANEIGPELFTGEHYQLRPSKGADRAYAVLCEALRAGQKVGVGRITIRGSEQLVVVRASQGQLVLSRIRWADEVREVAPVDRAEFTDGELASAVELIDVMSTKFDHGALADTSEVKLAALLTG